MSKVSDFTTITPLPAGITRQDVLNLYHNHVEMIKLNPLVIEHNECAPPEYAPADEHNSKWYSIKDKIYFLPWGLLPSTVAYSACFLNHPDSLQTHVYAPMGLDIRAKWSVGGRVPGEPEEPSEAQDTIDPSVDIPADGLYLREDVKMKCNVLLMAMTKKTFKESHKKLVDRLVEMVHAHESPGTKPST